MNAADYFLIAILLFSAIVGIYRGFLREVISVVSWVVALWVAWRFAYAVEPFFGLVETPELRTWIARALIFFVVVLAGAAIGAIVCHFVRLSIFSGTDRFFGFLFGVARGAILLGVIVILGQYLQVDRETWWQKSRLMPYADGVAAGVRAVVGDRAAQLHAGEPVSN